MDEIGVLRMLERILAVLIGGFSIYLGFRLFFHIPLDSEHSGSLELPGIKLVLTKVGPGVFFAAFGSVVVAYSLGSPVQTELQRKVTSGASGAVEQAGMVETSMFSGMGPLSEQPVRESTAPASVSPQQRNGALQAVEMINCLHRLSEPHDDLHALATPAVRQAKRALLLSVWDIADWGDPAVLDEDMQTLADDSPLQFFYHARYGGCPG